MFTRSLRVAFVTLSLLAPALTSAQEELPAPSSPPPRGPLRRPLTDQDRVQRRERLLNLGGQVLNALVPTDPNAPGAIPAIDMERLNGALGPLATALLGGGRDIESLRIGFDPQATNFAEDRLRLNFDAKLRRTAWADAPSRAVGGISAQVSQSDSGGLVAVLDGRMRMQTPTVALANYMVAQYKNRERRASLAVAAPAPADVAPAPVDTGTDDLFSQLLDERLARVDRLESLDDVADLLTAISGLRLTAADQRIEQLRNQVRSAKDETARQASAKQLQAAREERDRLFDVRPRITRGADGTAQLIALDMIGSELLPGVDMRQMECRILANEITIQASGAVTRWMELYPVVKPLVMGVLQRIQNGDPRALDGVRPFVDGPIGQGRAIIIGEP